MLTAALVLAVMVFFTPGLPVFWGILASIIWVALAGFTMISLGEKNAQQNLLAQKVYLIRLNREGMRMLSVQLDTLKQQIERQEQRLDQLHKQNHLQREQLQALRKEKEFLIMANSQSLELSRKIQNFFLPSPFTFNSAFLDSFVLFDPRDGAGGDFLWFYRSPQYVFLALGDCPGHGTEGTLKSLLGKFLLDRIVMEQCFDDPGDILNTLHSQWQKHIGTTDSAWPIHMDLAICRFSLENNQLTFAGAQRPMVIFNNHQMQELKGEKVSVGASYQKLSPAFSSQSIELADNTICYLFTDGYTDQLSSEGKKIGTPSLRRLFSDIYQLPMQDQKIHLSRHFDKHKGEHPQTDDVTVLGVRVERNTKTRHALSFA